MLSGQCDQNEIWRRSLNEPKDDVADASEKERDPRQNDKRQTKEGMIQNQIAPLRAEPDARIGFGGRLFECRCRQ